MCWQLEGCKGKVYTVWNTLCLLRAVGSLMLILRYRPSCSQETTSCEVLYWIGLDELGFSTIWLGNHCFVGRYHMNWIIGFRTIVLSRMWHELDRVYGLYGSKKLKLCWGIQEMVKVLKKETLVILHCSQLTVNSRPVCTAHSLPAFFSSCIITQIVLSACFLL